MDDVSQLRIKLLSDVPAEADEFGPHQRLAEAIAHLVTSEHGGKCIGLEGEWGSGKSTVIRLVRNELDPDEPNHDTPNVVQPAANTLVMVFDAWAHQGDPLRRTFLEKLIDRVVGKWMPGRREHWDSEKLALGKQKTVAKTRTEPALNSWSKAFIIAVFLVPLGLALLSSALKENVVAWWLASCIDWKISLEYFFGSLFTAGPLVILLWSLIARCFGRSPDMSSLWAVFASKIVTDVYNETIQTPEPTSIEFEKTFSELMAEALCSSPVGESGDEPVSDSEERRVLLVLDNLDRVQPEDALTVWSTMQTFLQASEHERPPWFERIWVLVPYDPVGIQRLWDGEPDGSEDIDADAEDEDASGDEPAVSKMQSSGITSSFLDKSLQVRFEVPPPMISGWRGYLLDRLRESLKGCSESDLHTAVNIYSMLREDTARPTPRQLKLFVNQMGVVLRQWGNQFPLAQVAYYVMLRHCGRCMRAVDLVVKLQAGEIPEERIHRWLGEAPQENLAAMVFNVEPKQAMELLLRDKLMDALEAGDGSDLAQLASNHRGFWDVMASIGICDWINADPYKLANAAQCLYDSKLIKEPLSSEMNLAVKELTDAAKTLKSLTPLEEGTAKGAACVINLAPDAKVAESLLSLLPKSVPGNQQIAALDNPEVATTWVEALLELLRTMASLDLSSAWSQGVVVPNLSKSFISVCTALAALDPDGEFWPLLRTDSSVEEVAATMAQPPEGSTTPDIAANLATVRVMKACSMQPPWETIAKTAVDAIVSAQSTASSEIEDALDILWEMRGVSSAGDTALKQLANQGYALHHLHSAGHDADAEIRASLALVHVLYSDDRTARPSTPPGAAAGFDELNTLIKQPDDSFVDAISSRIIRTSHLQTLFGVAHSDSAVLPLAARCVDVIARSDSEMTHVSPGFVSSEWNLLHSAMNRSEQDALLKLLADRPGFLEGIMESAFDTELASLYTMIVRILKKGSSFDDWCLKGLQSLDENQWYAQIDKERGCLDLVIALAGNDSTPQLDGAYGSAMARHATSIISNGASVQRLSKSWPLLIGYMRNDSRKSLAVSIRDAAMAADGQLSDQFLDVYGDELIDSGVLGDNGDVLDRLITPVAFTKPRVRRINWLTKLFDSNAGILSAYDTQQAADFRTMVQLQAKSASRKALRKHYQELYSKIDSRS